MNNVGAAWVSMLYILVVQHHSEALIPTCCLISAYFPQCSLIVTSDVSNLSTNRLRSIQKYQTPVVGVDYVYSCVERGDLLPVDGYRLDVPSPSASSNPPPVFSWMQQSGNPPNKYQGITL